jgi:phosphoribosyl-ATP pyrophosphohydrolase/phosphoribosyl-AMP cyclohydrolase
MDYSKMNGLIPAIIQDAKSNRVLMLGFMNKEAYKKTKREGKVTFFSRTRNQLWTKGEESGNFLYVKEILKDCDQDTVLIKAEPAGPVCHTGNDTCFNEINHGDIDFLTSLQNLIQQRKRDMPDNSYTTKLFARGINKIAQKVGEEAVELVIEAKDDDDNLFLNEAADLMYHLMVLLTAKGYALEDVTKILESRHR